MSYCTILLKIVSVETGVPGGKPLQRILGFEAYTNPAARQSLSPLSLLSLTGAAISMVMMILPLTLAQEHFYRVAVAVAHQIILLRHTCDKIL